MKVNSGQLSALDKIFSVKKSKFEFDMKELVKSTTYIFVISTSLTCSQHHGKHVLLLL